VVGTSGERLLVVLVVRESEVMEEMEDDGVWALCEGGGVEKRKGARRRRNYIIMW
jgi:hypothetical protein